MYDPSASAADVEVETSLATGDTPVVHKPGRTSSVAVADTASVVPD